MDRPALGGILLDQEAPGKAAGSSDQYGADDGGAPLRAGLPGCQIFLLFRREDVYFDAHRRELQPSDFFIDVGWYSVDAGCQLAALSHKVLGRQRLVSKTHVHDRRWVTFGGGEVEKASIGK
jgi:hypothetical protein